MAMKSSPDGCVVFFTDEFHGMVVHSEGDDLPRFGDIGVFVPDDFVDVEEDVVIWLTEGPVEPIYEAIAMVEKIKSLHETDATSTMHQLPDQTWGSLGSDSDQKSLIE